mgnify:CR=1 FL=1
MLSDRDSSADHKGQERVGAEALYQGSGPHLLLAEGRRRGLQAESFLRVMCRHPELAVLCLGRLQQAVRQRGAAQSPEDHRVDGLVSRRAMHARPTRQIAREL